MGIYSTLEIPKEEAIKAIEAKLEAMKHISSMQNDDQLSGALFALFEVNPYTVPHNFTIDKDGNGTADYLLGIDDLA